MKGARSPNLASGMLVYICISAALMTLAADARCRRITTLAGRSLSKTYNQSVPTVAQEGTTVRSLIVCAQGRCCSPFQSNMHRHSSTASTAFPMYRTSVVQCTCCVRMASQLGVVCDTLKQRSEVKHYCLMPCPKTKAAVTSLGGFEAENHFQPSHSPSLPLLFANNGILQQWTAKFLKARMIQLLEWEPCLVHIPCLHKARQTTLCHYRPSHRAL